MKKYELIKSDTEGLYRIKALRDFSDVKEGYNMLIFDILVFYKTLRKYKGHDKCIDLLINHYYGQVSHRMSEEIFRRKVNTIIGEHLLKKKGR